MRYANIIYNDLVNTDGVALTVFTQGCPHHCKGCFSKSTWDFNGGYELTIDVMEQLEYVISNYKYDYLCLIGGEPLDNLEVCELIKSLFRKHNKAIKVWLYTGYTISEILGDFNKKEFIKTVDVLVDGQFIEEEKDSRLKWRGSKNQRVINVYETLKQGEIILYDTSNLQQN